MIIDDNANSRSILKTHVNSWGMRAFLARSIDEALDIIRTKGQEIDIALLDTEMPYLGDLSPLERLRREVFEQPVILMGPFGRTSLAQDGETRQTATELYKPVKPHILKYR